jgi:membrane protease YdiL (CAAX protease family)
VLPRRVVLQMIDPTAPNAATWPIGTGGLLFLLVHVILLPALVLRSRKKIAGGIALPPKTRYFAGAIFQLTGFAVFAVLMADLEWIPLFVPYRFEPMHPVYALAALVLAVGFMRPRWRKAVERGGRALHFFSPETRLQMWLWVGVCFGAGIGEELTYRGVLTPLLERLLGNFALAALSSAIVYGVVHMVQGWKSAAVIVLFALGFQTLVFLCGSLYVAMVVHVVYDLIAGFTYGRLVREKRERDAAAAVSSAAT